MVEAGGGIDVIVIGGGIAGASAAYELAAFLNVLVVERESVCGYHSTGRSAASFTENYGPPTIRRLARAGRAFLESPPDGFCDHALVGPRGILTIARADQRGALDQMMAAALGFVPTMRHVGVDQALAMVPALRRDYLAAAILEPGSLDIDVNGLHHGFLRGARRRGARIAVDAEVVEVRRRDRSWRVVTRAGSFVAGIIVNAAGAWGDEVAKLAGVAPIGLTPKRRTAFNMPAPPGHDIGRWPLVDDVGAEFYFKPDAGQLLVSPADATPSPPTDVQPEDIDVATAVERLESASTMHVARIGRKWAGLRTFAADGVPVAGMDPEADGFFWLVGQGGYGVKTSPALGRVVAGLVRAHAIPDDVLALGLVQDDLAPDRLRAGRSRSVGRMLR
ncbi:MAG: FAD-binding oxidoreductase [Alphaproteobacteria bacterium]|nr:FAD-binding oxidoreductase [Alphaproteobacteria bacterium]